MRNKFFSIVATSSILASVLLPFEVSAAGDPTTYTCDQIAFIDFFNSTSTFNKNWTLLNPGVTVADSKLFVNLVADSIGNDDNTVFHTRKLKGDFEMKYTIRDFVHENGAGDYSEAGMVLIGDTKGLYVSWVKGENYSNLFSIYYTDLTGNTDPQYLTFTNLDPNTNTFKITKKGGNVQIYIDKEQLVSAATFTGFTDTEYYFSLGGGMDANPGDTQTVIFDDFQIGCSLMEFKNFQTFGGRTNYAISAVVFNGKSYQFVPGVDKNSSVYMRSSGDGLFDGEVDEAWSKLPIKGVSFAEIGTAVFNNKLYIAARGKNGEISTASMSTGGTWSEWQTLNGKAGGSIAMTAFGGKLYQAVKGVTDTSIYVRSSTDGVAWSNWIKSDGKTSNDIDLISFGGKLHMTVRGTDNGVYTRSTADGEFTAGVEAEKFLKTGTGSKSPVSSVVHNNVWYQAIGSIIDDRILTRSSTNGTTWSNWSYDGGGTFNKVGSASFGGKISQSVRGTNTKIYVRQSL